MAADVPAPTNFDAFPDPNHPFVSGLTTEAFVSGTSIDYLLASTAIPTGATLVATLTAGGSSGAAIVDIPAGATTLGAGATGDRRVYFADSEYPDVGGADSLLSANAEQILDNIINSLAHPAEIYQAEHDALRRDCGDRASGI